MDSAEKSDRPNRSLEFSFSSTQPVTRWDWDRWIEFDEVLSHESGHVRLNRVTEKACPLLWNHDRDVQIGTVDSVALVGDRADCKVRFSRKAKAQEVLTDIDDGIVSSVSFAYKVYQYEETSPAMFDADGKMTQRPIWKATDWELMEVSFVTIPADPTVGMGKAEGNPELVAVRSAFGEIPIKKPSEPTQQLTIDMNMPIEKAEDVGAIAETVREAVTQELAKSKGGNLKAAKVSQSESPNSKERQSMEDLELLKTQVKEQTDAIAQFKSQLSEKDDIITGLQKQVATHESAISERDAKIATLEKQQTVSDRYHSLRQKAEDLVADAKISAKEFNTLFNDAIADDLASLRSDEGAIQHLRNIEFYLKTSEARSPILPTEAKTGSEPIAKRGQDDEAIARAAEKRREAAAAYESAWQR